jgi:hypothetical protein
MPVLIFVLFFLGFGSAFEVAPLIAANTDADISTLDHGGAALKPVPPKASRVRQLKDRMAAKVVHGHERHGDRGYPADSQTAFSSAAFPQQNLYKLQRVYRR